MAKTPSNMMPIGTPAPDFTLVDTRTKKTLSLHDIKGQRATLIMFICNHCPYVTHIISELAQICAQYQSNDIGIAAISSNDIINYPQDAPENMSLFAEQHAFCFPYLFDPTQEVAEAYQAACTPDFFLFNHNLECIYRGQFDSSRPGNTEEVNGADLKHALDQTLQGKTLKPEIQKASLGCNIKWKQ